GARKSSLLQEVVVLAGPKVCIYLFGWFALNLYAHADARSNNFLDSAPYVKGIRSFDLHLGYFHCARHRYLAREICPRCSRALLNTGFLGYKSGGWRNAHLDCEFLCLRIHFDLDWHLHAWKILGLFINGIY